MSIAAYAAKPAADIDVASFTLDVLGRKTRTLDARVQNSITDGELERTTDGASTLTVTLHDPERVLLTSGMFSRQIDVRLDRLYFRLMQVQKRDDALTLVFEDRDVARLRARTGPSKAKSHGKPVKPEHASRAKVTRAEFAFSLVRELKPSPTFVCPQLHKRQPIAGQTDKRKGRRELPYQFRRGSLDGKPESSWDCLQRLAEEVGWRCFSNEGRIFFVSDNDLLAAGPKLIVRETTAGVIGVDFDIDNGKVRSEVTLTAHARRWAADPGSVVQLQDLGPADGMWIVHEVRRGLYDTNATITLRKRTQPLPEPAAETQDIPSASTRKSKASPGFATADADVNTAETAYAAAAAISAKRYPYVWGGGHSRCGVADRGTGRDPGIGYDCSGSVCAVLGAAGMGFTLGGGVQASGGLMGWGVGGRGTYLTVYANAVHTFIVFHTKKGDVHFGTGDWGKSWGGAGLNPNMHPTSGFVARHWPGT